MPKELQVKLLRALQEREIERIGGKSPIHVNVRIIAATNRNLQEEVAAGRFRGDLYFRISTFPIKVPPLRERADDIPALATYFLDRFAKRAGKTIESISAKAMSELVAYPWPGNVRELEHQMERCVLMTKGSTVMEVFLPAWLPVKEPVQGITRMRSEKFKPKTYDEFEREVILHTLKFCGGKISGTGGAAELLGLPASTLTSKMKRLHIAKKILLEKFK
jgi:transcriptional regulator with GAF, ATPase, and Fis domain